MEKAEMSELHFVGQIKVDVRNSKNWCLYFMAIEMIEMEGCVNQLFMQF